MVDFRWKGRIQISALQKRHTAHLRGASVVHPENQVAGMGAVVSHSPHLGATALAKHLVT